jgi:hypothetical protein
LFEKTSPSVAKVYGLSEELENNRSGTAFSTIAEDRLVLITNKHVVEKASVLVIETADGIWVSPRWEEHPDLDIALISLPDGASIPPLRISTASNLRPGRRVFSVGYPLGESITIQEGIVSTLNGTELVYSAPLSTGASGSPLLTEDGSVVGLCHSFMPDAQNYNFAIPSDFILMGKNWTARESSPDPSLTSYLKKVVRAKSITLKMRQEWKGIGKEFPEWQEWIRRTDMTRSPLLQAIEDMQLAIHSVEWGNVGSPLHRDADLLSAVMIKRNATAVEAAWSMHSKNIKHCAPHAPATMLSPILSDDKSVTKLTTTAKVLASKIVDVSKGEKGEALPTDSFAIKPPAAQVSQLNTLAIALSEHLQAEEDWLRSPSP